MIGLELISYREQCRDHFCSSVQMSGDPALFMEETPPLHCSAGHLCLEIKSVNVVWRVYACPCVGASSYVCTRVCLNTLYPTGLHLPRASRPPLRGCSENKSLCLSENKSLCCHKDTNLHTSLLPLCRSFQIRCAQNHILCEK